MALHLPKQEIFDLRDYQDWLLENGIKDYDEVCSYKKKAAILQEYIAVCYAKKSPVQLDKYDDRTIKYLSNRN